MKCKLIVFFLLLAVSIGQIGLSVDASPNENEEKKEIPSFLLKGALPEELTLEIVDYVFPKIKAKLIDEIRLLRQNKSRMVKTLESERRSVYSVTFSPDGKMLASGSNRTIKLWDVEKREAIKTLKGHRGSFYSVTFSPDGKVLASGLSHGKIKLWHVEKREAIKTLEGHRELVLSVSFSPDGKVLASGSTDKKIKLWHLYDKEDQEVMDTLKRTYSLNPHQKMLLYVLHVNKKEAKKEKPNMRCWVNLAETEKMLKEMYQDKPVPEMLNIVETYHGLPNSLKKVVKDYYSIME